MVNLKKNRALICDGLYRRFKKYFKCPVESKDPQVLTNPHAGMRTLFYYLLYNYF